MSSENEISQKAKILDSFDFVSWKKNVSLLYQNFISHILEWPSLTCQFLPFLEKSEDDLYQKQSLIFGTNAPEQNFLFLAKAKTPNLSYKKIKQHPNPVEILEKETKSEEKFMEIQKSIPHQGPVLKARFMYNSCNILATRAKTGKIYIYDSQKEKDFLQLVLEGHEVEGSSLDWKMNAQELISGSNDGTVCLFDLNQKPQQENSETNKILYKNKYTFHNRPVNEVKFHKFQSFIFGTASDHNLSFWDAREGYQVPFFNVLAHVMEVQSFDFSLHDQFLCLSSSSNGLIKLWDMRKMNKALFQLKQNDDFILKIEWSPDLPSVFATSGLDHKIKLWDLAKIDMEEEKEGEEMFFVHSGHNGIISDFTWNPCEELEICSVDSKNQLQIFKPKDSYFYVEN